MRSRYRVGDPCQAHFITSTIVEWLPVFTTRACCDILADALVHCQTRKQLQIYAWVILDNHFHAIVAGPELSRTVAALKSWTARCLLEQVEREGREWLLNQLRYYRAKHKTESNYQIWQEGFHPQGLSDDEAMEQKLDYLHNNPVARGWVNQPEHWRYSSAHEWMPGSKPRYGAMRGVDQDGREAELPGQGRPQAGAWERGKSVLRCHCGCLNDVHARHHRLPYA